MFPDGRVYEGQWRQNMMSGEGLYSYPSGIKYKGQFKEDVREGYGIYTFKDGRTYKGEWKENKQHGQGTYTTKEGSKVGIWHMGKRIKWLYAQGPDGIPIYFETAGGAGDNVTDTTITGPNTTPFREGEDESNVKTPSPLRAPGRGVANTTAFNGHKL